MRPRRHVLLLGPPGTGKTATAGAIAQALGLPFFVARLESIIDSYLGHTGRNLREVFDAVRTVPGVYLLDEFDAIGSSRESKGRTDVAEMRRALNTLLTFMEEDGEGMIVAATNLTAILDTAMFRRFELVLEYRLPTPDDAEILVRRTLERAGLAPDKAIDWPQVRAATAGLSHDNIVKATMSAARTCVLDGERTVRHRPLVAKLEMVRNAG